MTAAVPDPRFRDKLLGASTAVGDMAADWWCPKRKDMRRDECRYCIAEYVVDALMPAIAAEVEARVQAAAGQRAAEAVHAAADWIWDDEPLLAAASADLHVQADAIAAALAQPAPATDEAGQAVIEHNLGASVAAIESGDR